MDLSGYAAAVAREIDPELAVARQLQALFHQWPWPYVQLMQRSTRFWSAFCRIIRGESTYSSFRARLGPAALLVDLAAAYARRGQQDRAGWQPPR